MDLVLKTRNLTKTFGSKEAVGGIDLAVPKGSFYGFLGPNGAGKSTTIKCLTGLLTPTDGEIEIFGLDPHVEEIAVKKQLGVVPEDLALFDHLSPLETLQFVGRVHGICSEEFQKRVVQLLDIFDLTAVASQPVVTFSHGMKKKTALATALLPNPKLLFLDEPFEGIDAVASHQIRQILQAFVEKGGTIFLTSHILEIVDRLCDHVAVIHEGKLVTQGSMEELRKTGASGDSLERLFLKLIGAKDPDATPLEWLGT